jgi:hypothetical protein
VGNKLPLDPVRKLAETDTSCVGAIASTGGSPQLTISVGWMGFSLYKKMGKGKGDQRAFSDIF